LKSALKVLTFSMFTIEKIDEEGMTNDRLNLMHLKIKILRNTQQRCETKIHALSGIRTRVTSKIGIDACYPSLGRVPTNRNESCPVQSIQTVE